MSSQQDGESVHLTKELHPRSARLVAQAMQSYALQDKFFYLLRLTLPQNVCANNEHCMGFNYDALLSSGTCHYKAALDKAYVRVFINSFILNSTLLCTTARNYEGKY